MRFSRPLLLHSAAGVIRRSPELRRRISSSSVSSACHSLPPTPVAPPKPHHSLPPLFLRPLSHPVAASSLADFRRWAASVVDGSPSLLRELSWLLDDAGAASQAECDSSSVINLRADLAELRELWRERVFERRPFQYLCGCEHWRDLVLAVKPGVLIPRPETELVVDLVGEVECFDSGWWADLGTGSGAIAVALARMLGDGGRVLAVDLSSDAVEVAALNAERVIPQPKLNTDQVMTLPNGRLSMCSRRYAMILPIIGFALRALPAKADDVNVGVDDDDNGGVVGTIKSLFDPNEKTKSGKILPKAYLRAAREVVKTLRESLEGDRKDVAKFRRNADAAKEAIREYLTSWRGQQAVAAEESYAALERAIRSLAEFYSKAGPLASLSDEVKLKILDELKIADDTL